MVIGGGARGMLFTQLLEKRLGHTVAAIVEPHLPSHAFVRHMLDEDGIVGPDIIDDAETAFDRYPASEIDGVFIMTPEWTHAEVFRSVTDRGYNVFLEKPIATSVEDVEEISAIAEFYPGVIQLGFVLRYSTFYRKVKEWLDGRPLGRIVTLQLNERLTVEHGMKFKRSWHRKVAYTGGFMNEKCSHDLDLMCWFKEDDGAKPVRVVSMGNRGFATEDRGQTNCSTCTIADCLFRDSPDNYAKQVGGTVLLDSTAAVDSCIYSNDSDINDNQTVMIQFDDGSHGVFSTVAMSGLHGRDLMIHLEYGMIWGNLEEGRLTKVDYRTGATEVFGVEGMDMHGGGDEQVVHEFVECIVSGSRPLARVEDGARASLLALLADASIAQLAIMDVAR